MIPAILGAILPIIDKIIPDPQARDAAKLELIKQQNSAEMGLVEQQLSAIIAEAKSTDPWTSRARPSFLYVIYTLILASIPMGFLTAYQPDVATNVTVGFKDWLAAIPSDLYWLFGAGYLGYTGARTLDKKLPWQK